MGLTSNTTKTAATSGPRNSFTVEDLEASMTGSTLVYADAGVGKTSFALSIFDYWESQGYKPEECLLIFLDNDKGIAPLVKKGLVPTAWRSALHGARNENWKDLTHNTKHFIAMAKEHEEKYGREKVLIVVDNMKNAWKWVRDQYALDTYGMPENELMVKKRKEAIASGKKMLPHFENAEADWGTINGMYERWITPIVMCDIPFLLLAPEDNFIDRRNDDEHVIKPGGQKDNPYRVDNILRIYREGENRFADAEKAREAPKLFRRMPDPSFSKLMGWLESKKGE